MFRGYFPALLAVNLATITVFSAPWVLDLILGEEVLALTGVMSKMPGIVVLLMFTTGLSMMIFAPTWFLNDAGIVYSNKEAVIDTDQPVEVRTVGGRFIDYLRGYAGIGVIWSYAQLLLLYVSEIEAMEIVNAIDLAPAIVFVLGSPVFMLSAPIPALIVLDIIRERRIRFVRNSAKEMGITKFVEVSFEEVDQQ